jgi:Nif-specific regulatory protein
MARDDTISDLAFPCKGNRCLTQVLHRIDREDAVTPSRLADIAVVEVPMAPPMAAPTSAATAAPQSANMADDAAETTSPDQPTLTPSDSDGKPEGERERLIWAMERCGWVQAKAARLLKISPRQMGYALQKNGIEVRKF